MLSKMKRALLTGAGGFIGGHCIPELLAAGFEVHAVSTASARTQAGVTWHQCDLLDSRQADKLITSLTPSHLLHSAWYVVPGKIRTATENLAWVQASINLLLKFHAAGGRRAVVLGSGAEYAPSFEPCDELRTPLDPVSLYGVAKNALHSIVQAYSRQTGLSYAWGRVFVPYGPGEPLPRLIPHVINCLLEGKPAKCTAGTQLRDFIYVEDAANAIVKLLDAEVQGPVNIGSGRQVLLREVVSTIGELMGREDLIELGAIPMKASEDPVYAAGIERLYNELQWRPRHELKDALRKTIDWWQIKVSSGRPI